jgi:hypothetical protein
MPSKEGDDWERGTYFHAGFQSWFKLVLECQDIARRGLTTFVDEGEVELEVPMQKRVLLHGSRRKGGERQRQPQSLAHAFDTTDYQAEVSALARGEKVQRDPLKGIRNLFLARLGDILDAGSFTLSRCESPTCKRGLHGKPGIYIKALQNTQRFCSDGCRAREAQQKYRDRQREIREHKRKQESAELFKKKQRKNASASRQRARVGRSQRTIHKGGK